MKTRVCMYVYIYIGIYTYIHIHIHIQKHIHIHIHKKPYTLQQHVSAAKHNAAEHLLPVGLSVYIYKLTVLYLALKMMHVHACMYVAHLCRSCRQACNGLYACRTPHE